MGSLGCVNKGPRSVGPEQLRFSLQCRKKSDKISESAVITFDLSSKDMKLKPNLNLGRLNQCKSKYEKNVVKILPRKNSALHCGSLLLLLKKNEPWSSSQIFVLVSKPVFLPEKI